MNEPRGATMRKDTGIPGIPLPRRSRTLLTALVVVLAFLLGGMGPAAGAAATAFAAPAAKPAGAPPAAKPSSDNNEEKTKRETERGQPRGAARTSAGAPHHPGRPLPPYTAGPPAPYAATAFGGPSAGGSTKAARPASLPILHCVFRC
ncbi:hypothetical protein ACTPOK_38845 [Streptomyces inhibens]|uniref:hypothetical protein n=1 Tax=Streptomyces inhibens TaxID=2293571 RepID=UPI00402AD511